MNSQLAIAFIAALMGASTFVAGGLTFVYVYRKGVEDEADAVTQYEREERNRTYVPPPQITPFTPPRTKWFVTKHAVHSSDCRHLPHLIETGKATPWPWPDTEDEAVNMAREQNLRACRTCTPFTLVATDPLYGGKDDPWLDEMIDPNDHSAPAT